MDALHWVLLAAIGLLALAGLNLVMSGRETASRVHALEHSFAQSDGAEEARRAHVRCDNLQLQVDALARELGWVDDRHHTKVITLPPPADESP